MTIRILRRIGWGIIALNGNKYNKKSVAARTYAARVYGWCAWWDRLIVTLIHCSHIAKGKEKNQRKTNVQRGRFYHVVAHVIKIFSNQRKGLPDF
jgi:hypothetical protein